MDTTDGNIALRKTAFMSSRYNEDRHIAAWGVDGNVDTYFHTEDKKKESWWAVDFGETRTRVTRVRIVNANSISK